MITEIDFKVKGEERKKLAYAIGELLGMPVKYTRTPKFDYLIGSSILDKNGVFYASEYLTESKLELVLERFYKGEPIQQSEQSENEIVEADVLSISVPRNMFADDKLENLQKLIEGKQTLFKHAFLTEQSEVVITENQGERFKFCVNRKTDIRYVISYRGQNLFFRVLSLFVL